MGRNNFQEFNLTKLYVNEEHNFILVSLIGHDDRTKMLFLLSLNDQIKGKCARVLRNKIVVRTSKNKNLRTKYHA